MDNKKGAQSRYYYIESKEVLKSLKKIEKKDVDGACRTRRFSRRGLFSPFKFLLTPKKEKNLQSPCFFFFSISNKPPRRSKFGTASNRDWKTRPAVPFYFQGYADYIVYTDNIFPTLLKNEAIKSVRRERI